MDPGFQYALLSPKLATFLLVSDAFATAVALLACATLALPLTLSAAIAKSRRMLSPNSVTIPIEAIAIKATMMMYSVIPWPRRLLHFVVAVFILFSVLVCSTKSKVRVGAAPENRATGGPPNDVSGRFRAHAEQHAQPTQHVALHLRIRVCLERVAVNSKDLPRA